MSTKLLFTNAHLICPEQGIDGKGWLVTEGGNITAIGTDDKVASEAKDAELIDCRGDILAPGLVDRRVKTGDPGGEHLET